MTCRLALLLAAPLLLAGCTDDAAAPGEDDGREASGEVLEGSISDAMLPLDEVQSQPPLAEPEAAEAAAGQAGATGEGDTAETTADDAAPADPTETGPAPSE